jgi:hypothetical protein
MGGIWNDGLVGVDVLMAEAYRAGGRVEIAFE